MSHTFTKKHVDDECIEYHLDGELLIEANHDDDGWSGMARIDKLITKIAAKVGSPITEEFE